MTVKHESEFIMCCRMPNSRVCLKLVAQGLA